MTINSGDMAGILMIAVQALERRTAENAALRAELDELKQAVNALAAQSKPDGASRYGVK